jgi:hypothetical protein
MATHLPAIWRLPPANAIRRGGTCQKTPKLLACHPSAHLAASIHDEWDPKPILPHPLSVKYKADPKRAISCYQYNFAERVGHTEIGNDVQASWQAIAAGNFLQD